MQVGLKWGFCTRDSCYVAELTQPWAHLGGKVKFATVRMELGYDSKTPWVRHKQVSADSMIVKSFKLAVVFLAGLQLAGCYTDYGPVEVETRPVALSGAGVATHLRAGDKIKINVYGEEQLTGEYDINPSGYVSMPLIGSIRAAGRTQAELGRDIAA